MKDYFSLSSFRTPFCCDLVDDMIDVGSLVGKVHYLCRVKTIRIAVSTVMDGWEVSLLVGTLLRIVILALHRGVWPIGTL